MTNLKSVRMAKEFLEGGNVKMRDIDSQVHLENFKSKVQKFSFGIKPLKLIVAPLVLVVALVFSTDND